MKLNGFKKSVESGFSLVELMVVVTIIGILAGIAVPKFQTFRARATQTEAKSGLSGLYLAMQGHYANYSAYPVFALGNPTGAGIGFDLQGSVAKYDYRLVSAAGAWVGTAASRVALNDGGFDIWRVNTNKWLCARWDGAASKPGVAPTATTLKTAATPDSCPEAITTKPTAQNLTVSVIGNDDP